MDDWNVTWEHIFDLRQNVTIHVKEKKKMDRKDCFDFYADYHDKPIYGRICYLMVIMLYWVMYFICYLVNIFSWNSLTLLSGCSIIIEKTKQNTI